MDIVVLVLAVGCVANINPEQIARDQMLDDAGWLVQDYKALNLSAGQGIAVREVMLKSGRADLLS